MSQLCRRSLFAFWRNYNKNVFLKREFVNGTQCLNFNRYLIENNVFVKMRLCTPIFAINRFKSKKKGTQSRKDEESDSEDEFESDIIPEQGTKIISAHVNSLRLDLILKAGLSLARNKAETLFYSSAVRVNGKKVAKKSTQLHIGDEVDFIRGVSPNNPNFLVVSRVEVLSVTPKEDNLVVKLRRHKSMVIENYEEPWKASATEEKSSKQ